ncbi:MAG: large repetitive protein, partial [Frankiaceae bacterium]|nr:large repetitive protein [Frankiaceae bacterium]
MVEPPAGAVSVGDISTDGAAWTGALGGPGHDGHNSSALPPLPLQRWSRTFDGTVSSPIVSDGRVLLTVQPPNSGVSGTPGWAAEVVGLAASDGRSLWQPLPLASGVQAQAYADGRLLLVLQNGVIEAVDVADGQVAWVRNSGPYFHYNLQIAAADGVAVLSNDNNSLVSAVRVADGEPLWVNPEVAKYAKVGSPSFVGGQLVVEDECGAVILLNESTGAVKSGPTRTQACASVGGNVAVPVQGGRAFPYTRAGADVRSLPDLAVQSSVSVHPTSVDGDRVFGLEGGRAVAVDTHDNGLWTSAAADYLPSTIAVPGALVARSATGRVDLLSQIDGHLLFSTLQDDLNWYGASVPVAVGDGLLIDPHGSRLTAYGNLSPTLPVLSPVLPPLPVFAPPVPVPAVGTSWTGAGGNGRHDGDQPAEAMRPPLTRAWSADITGWVAGQPLVIPGAVVLASASGSSGGVDVHAYSSTTGNPLWAPVHVAGTYSEGGLSYSAGVIVADTGIGGHTAGISAATGTTLWDDGDPSQYSAGQPVAEGGKVYQESFQRDIFTGAVTNLGFGNTLPVVDGSTVWTLQCCWHIQRYDDGQQTSSGDLGGLSGGTGAFTSLQNGQLNVAAGGFSGLYERFSVDPISEKLVDSLEGHMPAAADGNVVVTTYFSDVVAQEARTHRVIWRTTLAKPLADQPIIAGGQNVFVRQISGEVDVLDAHTGAVLWSDSSNASAGWGVDSADFPGGMVLGQGLLVVPRFGGITVYRGVGGLTYPGPPIPHTDFRPSAPVAVSAVAGDGGAVVSWNPSTSPQSPVTGYDVSVVGSSGPAVHVGPSATSATINGLKNGQSYAFSVQASNANGAGPSATSALVTPAVPLTPPGPPTAVVGHAGSTSATVTWLPPASNGGSPITGYTVTSSPDDRSTTVGGSAVSAQLTGLTNGTSYTFTVRATNAKGSSAASTPSVAVTPRAP